MIRIPTRCRERWMTRCFKWRDIGPRAVMLVIAGLLFGAVAVEGQVSLESLAENDPAFRELLRQHQECLDACGFFDGEGRTCRCASCQELHDLITAATSGSQALPSTTRDLTIELMGQMWPGMTIVEANVTPQVTRFVLGVLHCASGGHRFASALVPALTAQAQSWSDLAELAVDMLEEYSEASASEWGLAVRAGVATHRRNLQAAILDGDTNVLDFPRCGGG